MRSCCLVLLAFVVLLRPASAVQVDKAGAISYQNLPPTGADIAGWNAGWGEGAVTGWNYVGQVHGTSAVYLGDDWVITAAHVGCGPFTLDGLTYPMVNGSRESIANSSGTADLIMFRIAPAPALPSLSIGTRAPSLGDQVVMIGFGGGHGETWGENIVSRSGLGVLLVGQAYKTFDFETDYGGPNQARLVVGDSGGGDFIFNSSTGRWELAGINESIDSFGSSCMVQLNAYSDQIDVIRYPRKRLLWRGTLILLLCGLGLVLVWKLKFWRQKR